ncbi:hypothetical protein LY78DRAFT_124242 [Colletotrichum sublineola]|nr:hypothetical protein LY78DRAFT_124242 [Colletotrichum sublineola]
MDIHSSSPSGRIARDCASADELGHSSRPTLDTHSNWPLTLILRLFFFFFFFFFYLSAISFFSPFVLGIFPRSWLCLAAPPRVEKPIDRRAILTTHEQIMKCAMVPSEFPCVQAKACQSMCHPSPGNLT